ncbi:MAG: ATP-binding protein [Desulfobulbaceae bacterium]|nr:ATP-binding protein [Desulfobulbaceae bacterium]HIJ79180.1 PAS domain-containing protein [Deltaproteobacteria bacterium]
MDNGHENFKEQFEKSLVRKTVVGLIVLSVTVAFISILPLYQQLKSQQKNNLVFAVLTKCSTVDEFLSKAKETAMQITSRSRIRAMLEKYNLGEIDLKTLVEDIEPKMIDAMKSSEFAEGITRYDRQDHQVLQVGLPIPVKYQIVPDAAMKMPVVHGPLTVAGRRFMVVAAPIINRRGERVGTDFVMFTIDRLQELVADYKGLGASGEMILGYAAKGGAELFFPLREASGRIQPDPEYVGIVKRAFSHALNQGGGKTIGIEESSRDLAAYQPVDNADWAVVVRMDKLELFRSVNRQVGIIVVLICLLIFIGVRGIISLLLRPLADKAIVHSNKLQQEIQAKTMALHNLDLSEKKLFAEREQLDVTLRSISDGVITTDTAGQIALVNAAAEKMLGVGHDEVIGKNIAEIFPLVDGNNRQPIQMPIAEIVAGRQIVSREDDYVYVAADGGERNVQVSCAPILDRQNTAVGVVFSARDVTERLRLEGQLRQENKMKAIGRLAGGVAHDFNNMLTVILGYSQLLLERLQLTENLREPVEAIYASAVRASVLTRQLLAFSRKQKIEMKPVRLSGLISNMANMLQRMIGEDVEIHLIDQTQEGVIMADAGQVEQIVMNLAVNAKDAMPYGGRLSIEISDCFLDDQYAASHEGVAPGPYVCLAVSDSGAGMSKDIQDKIFDPFFTTKDVGSGTGLGLAMVYGIVQQHKAHIHVDSEPALGTTFRIYFPRLSGITEPAQVAIPEAAPLRQGTETLLVVDDESYVRKLIVDTLQPLGYSIIEAGSGGEALAIIDGNRDKHIDLLLTDVIMPGMGGRELAQKVAAVAPQIKIVFMSGYTDDIISPHVGVGSGADFINKPLVPNEFARRIQDILGADEQG